MAPGLSGITTTALVPHRDAAVRGPGADAQVAPSEYEARCYWSIVIH